MAIKVKHKESDVPASLAKEFERFFVEHYSRFYYYALSLIPDEEVCKDIVYDSFHYMWENIETFRMSTAVTYMYTHVQRLCIDHIRRDRIKENHKDNYPKMLREWNDAEHKESERRIAIIMRLIAEMPALTRTVMEECYLYKRRYREVAELTGLSESGVRKHVMKGLDIIRKYFSVKYKKGSN